MCPDKSGYHWEIGLNQPHINNQNNIHTNKLVAVVLDDDEDTRFAISRILGKCDCDTLEASSVDAAMGLIAANKVDVVFSDMRIPGQVGGEELLGQVLNKYPDVDVVLMSCAMDTNTRARLLSAGASECLMKPFYKETCLDILNNLKAPLKKSA